MTDSNRNDQYAHDLFDLTDRVAVITGGAGMLGVRHAEALAEFGASLVILDINEKAAREAASKIADEFGVEAIGIGADITEKNQVDGAVRAIQDKFGRIDILINNAAMTVAGGGGAFGDYFTAFEQYPRELFDLALQVNLTGAFLVTQAVGNVMLAQERGVILNISSDVGSISPDHRIYEGMEYGGKPFNTPIAYSMSKAAILAFTRYLATYWANKGIRANAISPGGVFDDHDGDFVERLTNLIPLGRMARKDEYKGAIVFLCSDASAYMTGANLAMDGGRTAW